MVRPGLLAIDGTKLKASASLDANRSYACLKDEYEELAWRILEEAERVGAEEDLLYGPEGRGDEIPEEMRDRDKRRRWIAERLREMENEADRLEAEQHDKIERQEERRKAGEQRIGRRPLPPQRVRERFLANAKANTTDPDSRIMKGPKGYLQGYNTQVATTEDQVIVAASLSEEEADWGLLHPMVERLRELEADGGEGENRDRGGGRRLRQRGQSDHGRGARDHLLHRPREGSPAGARAQSLPLCPGRRSGRTQRLR